MYSVDWMKVVSRSVPGVLRKPRLKALLAALISPIVTLFTAFGLYRDAKLLDINMNGQVRRLQYGLNQRFDPALSRIIIKDAIEPDLVFAFLESENRPLFLPVFLSGVLIDFIVCVPAEYEIYEITIRAYIDRYKLVTKRYRIEYI